MANLFGKVSVGITASTGSLTRGLSRAASEIRSFGGSVKRIDIATSFLAARAAVGMMTRAVSTLARSMNFTIQSAASLTEAQNRVGVVFGDSADMVRRFAKTTSQIGIAETQALSTAGLFGTLFNNIGMTEQASASMSMRMVQLAADMASFNDVSIEDSLRAIRSALVGEVEPIRRLGIMLSDASLRQQAFAMGLTETTTKVLPPAIKMQAALALILEKSAIQQGDFAKTSQELTNQQRILSSNFNETATSLGKRFLPAMLEIVTAINDSVPNVRALIDTLADLFRDATAGFMSGVSAADAFAFSLEFIAGYATALRGMFQVLTGVIAKFAQFYQQALASGADLVAMFIENIEYGIYRAIEIVTYPLQVLFQAIASGLKALGQNDLADALGFEDAATRLGTMTDAVSGIGEDISGGIRAYADQARRNGEDLARFGDQLIEDGARNIWSPFEAYREKLGKEMLNEAAGSFIGLIPEVGNIFGQAANAVAGAVSASTKDLKAFVVGTSGGEAFRNAILRGADPRLAANNDQKIADNTGRMAEGIDALPEALAASIGDAMSAASISV